MVNEILFKNGELEVAKTISEVMTDTRNCKNRKAIIPTANFTKGIFQLKSLDCNFHFVKDVAQYARLLECAYFVGAVKAMTSEVVKLETKRDEDGALTWEQENKLEQMTDTIDIFNDVISKCYTPEEIAFSQADKLIKFMSVYFNKDTSCFANLNGFISFFNNLTADKPTQVLKPLLEKVMNNFTIGKEDSIYKTYRFHANTTLIEDCKQVYYKGRKIHKSKVVKTYDDKGNAVKLEIVLAVIEDLQRRSRKTYEEEEAKIAKAEAEAKKKAEEAKKKAEEEAVKKAKAKAEEAKKKAEEKK